MIDKYIQRHGRRLYGLCRSLCPSPFDADDLYQETWLRVIKYIDKYDLTQEFEPWLTKICVNTYRSRLRQLTRSPLLNFSSSEEKDRLLDSLPVPEDKDYSPLYEAVGGLPDKLRLAVAGALFEALSALLGLLCMEAYPMLALGCICFAIISIVGSGVIAIVFTQKGGMSCGSVY